VNILGQLVWEAGSFYIVELGHLDFARGGWLHQCGAFFVTRANENFLDARRDSRPVEKTGDLRFDPTVGLTGLAAQHDYPDPLRRPFPRGVVDPPECRWEIGWPRWGFTSCEWLALWVSI